MTFIKDSHGYLSEIGNARRHCLRTAVADLNFVAFVCAVSVAYAEGVQLTGRSDQVNLTPIAEGGNCDIEQLCQVGFRTVTQWGRGAFRAPHSVLLA
jgi:hypothetical protein